MKAEQQRTEETQHSRPLPDFEGQGIDSSMESLPDSMNVDFPTNASPDSKDQGVNAATKALPDSMDPVVKPLMKSPAPLLPKIVLMSISDDGTSKTPTCTPHTLADMALMKSEMLLAELAALGLSAEDERDVTEKEADDTQASEGYKSCPKSGFASPVTPKVTFDVDTPIALLNLFEKTVKLQPLGMIASWDNSSPEPEPEAISTTDASTTDELSISVGSIADGSSLGTPLTSQRSSQSPQTDCRVLPTVAKRLQSPRDCRTFSPSTCQ